MTEAKMSGVTESGVKATEMKASEILAVIKAGKPVQFIDKIILDDLDFTQSSEPYIMDTQTLQVEVPVNIFFNNCIFMGKVSSTGKQKSLSVIASFRRNLVFTGCDFRGEVDFSRTVVWGQVNFSQSNFREVATFNNICVWAKDSYFSEVKAEKDFSMIYASYAGNLYAISAQFSGVVSFQEMSVKGKLLFNHSVFSQRAGFDLMEIGGNVFFHRAKFGKVADFSFSRFLNNADFSSAEFAEKGNFEKTFFQNPAIFDKTNF
ncbi:hypothetical protein FACS1894199_07310 [Bacteroidia bacterium]|nr:hypothetical protein FACS1894199_07310 [Bacteroidia bacterium]